MRAKRVERGLENIPQSLEIDPTSTLRGLKMESISSSQGQGEPKMHSRAFFCVIFRDFLRFCDFFYVFGCPKMSKQALWEPLGEVLGASWRPLGSIFGISGEVFGHDFGDWQVSLKRLDEILKILQIHCKVLQKSRFGESEIHGKVSSEGKLGPNLMMKM